MPIGTRVATRTRSTVGTAGVAAGLPTGAAYRHRLTTAIGGRPGPRRPLVGLLSHRRVSPFLVFIGPGTLDGPSRGEGTTRPFAATVSPRTADGARQAQVGGKAAKPAPTCGALASVT